jgi:hypothetical protein
LRFIWITDCKIGISDEKGNFLVEKAKTRQSTLKVKKNHNLSPFTLEFTKVLFIFSGK